RLRRAPLGSRLRRGLLRGGLARLELAVLLGAELRHRSDELHGDRLVEGKSDRALRDLVRGEVLLERLEDRPRGRAGEREVLLVRGVVEDPAAVGPERGD